MFRIPDAHNWPHELIDAVHQGDARAWLPRLPSECVSLIVTSPPYWNTVDYHSPGQIGQSTYEDYLSELTPVWRECARVLIPNGKLAIVAPIMPVPKKVLNDAHTRHLNNISADIERTILDGVESLSRFSLFVWQKQTTQKMFGSYPYPPNIYEDNTVEFICVYVKEGKTILPPREIKEASRLSQTQWRNLTMQVWPLYPADVKRSGGHPCPFPEAIPQRLIAMYTFRASPEQEFAGDVVLDPFAGAGAACLAAKAMGRRYIGCELNSDYVRIARERIEQETLDPEAYILDPNRVRRAITVESLRTTGSI